MRPPRLAVALSSHSPASAALDPAWASASAAALSSSAALASAAKRPSSSTALIPAGIAGAAGPARRASAKAGPKRGPKARAPALTGSFTSR